MSDLTVLAVDGNSLTHRAFHANARLGFRLPGGVGAWAVRGLLAQLTAAADRACADAVVVAFDDPEASVRRQRWPQYKAQRAPKVPELESQLALAAQTVRDLGVAVVMPPGLEADDVLASVAAYAPTVGARTVLVTSDRDAFALIDEHTRLLRIINGGVEASPMLDPVRARMVTGVRPDQYRDLAALRGDPSDNLPGVRGVGAKKGAALLNEFGSAAAVFDDIEAGGERCRGTLGAALTRALSTAGAREAWAQNCAIMTMYTDVELGFDARRGPGLLPLSHDAVRAVYDRFELGVPNALRALCGVEERRALPDDVDPSWRPAPVRSAARFPPLRRPAVPTPAHVQPTLF